MAQDEDERVQALERAISTAMVRRRLQEPTENASDEDVTSGEEGPLDYDAVYYDHENEYTGGTLNRHRRRPRTVNARENSLPYSSRSAPVAESAISAPLNLVASSCRRSRRATSPSQNIYGYEYPQAGPSTSSYQRQAHHHLFSGQGYPFDVERASSSYFPVELRIPHSPPSPSVDVSFSVPSLPSHSLNEHPVSAPAAIARSSLPVLSLWDRILSENAPPNVSLSSRFHPPFLSDVNGSRSQIDSLPTASQAWSSDHGGNTSIVTLDVSTDSEPTDITEPEGVDRLQKNLASLLEDEESSDVLFKVEGREFRAHKIILQARCPVFACMFKPHTKESSTGVVEIPDCSAAAFEIFLLYLYTGSGTDDKITSGNVCDLYYVSDKYQIDDLKAECVRYMKSNLSVDNFCQVMTLSLQHNESHLQKVATRFFCINVKKIIETDEWQKYLKDYPVQANELFKKVMNS